MKTLSGLLTFCALAALTGCAALKPPMEPEAEWQKKWRGDAAAPWNVPDVFNNNLNSTGFNSERVRLPSRFR